MVSQREVDDVYLALQIAAESVLYLPGFPDEDGQQTRRLAKIAGDVRTILNSCLPCGCEPDEADDHSRMLGYYVAAAGLGVETEHDRRALLTRLSDISAKN